MYEGGCGKRNVLSRKPIQIIARLPLGWVLPFVEVKSVNKSYLAVKRVFLVAASTFLESGDILLDDPASGEDLTVHRNQKVVATVKQTRVGIDSMLKAEIIMLIEDNEDAESAVKIEAATLVSTD